jgi:hypothetical protein
MRGAILTLALSASALLPATALAVVAPINDSLTGAAPLTASFVPTNPTPIAPDTPAGGWLNATSVEDNQPTAPTPAPTCFGSSGYHSMWYTVQVPESTVLKVTLTSPDSDFFQPLVTIVDPVSYGQLACALGFGGGGPHASVTVSAASLIPKAGNYLIRIASANAGPSDDADAPTLQLSALLRDVTPPHLEVAVSQIVGVRKRVTFDATASTDGVGSGIDPVSALWTFHDSGSTTVVSGITSATPLVASHSWNTPGFHLVQLQLSDLNGNKSIYGFNVLVHSFVPPTVRLHVVTPKPGAAAIRVVVTHDIPVRVRLVVLQAGRILRVIPSKSLAGKHRSTSITIALKTKVRKLGNVFVSGTASDVSTSPNTVALKTCSVRPGKRGETCA